MAASRLPSRPGRYGTDHLVVSAKRSATGRTGKAGGQVPTPSKIPLQSLEDVRREAARVYREARGGRLDTSEASKLSFMLQGLAKMIEAGQIERRIEALENDEHPALPAPDDVTDVEVIQHESRTH
jgi:hypothetical protein